MKWEVGENLTEVQASVFGPDTHMQGHVRNQNLLKGAPRHMTTVLVMAMLVCQIAAAHLIWSDWQLVCYMY